MPSVSPLIYIRQAISEGRSANSAYRAMRKDVADLTETTGQPWHGIGRSTFFGLYSQTLSSRAKVANALDYDMELLPDQTVTTNRESRYSRGYITWLTVFTRQVGEQYAEMEYFAVHSQEPITPVAAMAKAQEGFETAAQTEHGTRQGYRWVGATYSGTWRMQPITK